MRWGTARYGGGQDVNRGNFPRDLFPGVGSKLSETSVMRSRLIDRITQLEPGHHLQAVKRLHATEGYLEDHFPMFPIMPGVLMLEAMYQAAYWLVRKTEDFAHSMVVLKEARNIKFSGFVKPDQDLVVTAEVKKQDGNCTTLMTRGEVDGKTVATARLVVEAFELADRYPSRAGTRDYLMRKLHKQFERVTSGAPEPPPYAGLSMRWLWIDRFVEFVRGQRSVAIKNVSLTEEPLSEYVPGFPMLPCSLIVEGLAWTGGILANDQRGFRERTVLAKVNKAVFHRPALPGDQLRYTAVLEGIEAEGCFIRGTSHVGEELQAEVDLFLAHLGDRIDEVQGDLIDPADMLATLRIFGLYDVGRTATGEPLDVAEKLMEGERTAQAAVRGA
jgi:3-hydroxyacyl-[acyl-carrier-protein] dehydratase